MAKYLTPEWFQERKAIAGDTPQRAGVNIRMQNVVTGGPDGEVKYYDVIQDGQLVESTLGEDPEAEITMTTDYDTAKGLLTGEVQAMSAFMGGKVKVTGNTAKLMSMMPLANSPEYQETQKKLAESTQF